MSEYEPPTTVYGIDFSADRSRAGERIWIAKGIVDDAADGLRIVECQQATEFLDTGAERETALLDLARFLGSLDGNTAVALDVPFGLPETVIAADDWIEFLRRLPSWADDPSDFARESAHRASLDGDASQLLRATEEPLGTLSPYDDRLRAQTFYGMRDLLRPLALADAARALPIQPISTDRPSLLEVYPAGTLARLDGHDAGYATDDDSGRERRAENLDVLSAADVDSEDDVRRRAVENADGNALDAIVAALTAYEHTRDPSDLRTADDRRALEGHIYV